MIVHEGYNDILANFKALKPKLEQYIRLVDTKVCVDAAIKYYHNSLITDSWISKLSDTFDQTPVFLETDLYLIPFYRINTLDRGVIHSFYRDIYVPQWYEAQLDCCGTNFPFITIVPNGIQEVGLSLSTDFNTHVKRLSQVGRSLNKNKDVTTIEVLDKDIDKIYEQDNSLYRILISNLIYFLNKGDSIVTYTTSLDGYVFHITSSSNKVTVIVSNTEMKAYVDSILRNPFNKILALKLDDVIVGLVEYQVMDNEIYWVNSYLYRDEISRKSGLGNYSVLLLLKVAYALGVIKVFNLGLDVFPYKVVWKPDIAINRRGVELDEVVLCAG